MRRRTPTTRIALLGAAVALAGVLLTLLAGTASATQVPQDGIVSEDPYDNTPHVRGDGTRVYAVVQIGDKVFVGGEFSQVRNGPDQTEYARSNIFAYDAATGQVDTDFAPEIDGVVYTLGAAPGGQEVIAGGSFDNVDGVDSKKLAKLDVDTGERDPTFATAAGSVRDLVVHGDDLYIGGGLIAVNGQEKLKLAKLDAITGSLDNSFDIPVTEARVGDWPAVKKIDVTPDGSQLVAVGNFVTVAGQFREQIATVDLTASPPAVRNWATDRFNPTCASVFWTYIRDVEYSPTGDYFVTVTTGGPFPGTLCDTAARWETADDGPGRQPTWVDYTGGDTLYSVAITGPAVYVGGHQRWMNNPEGRNSAGPGAVPREGIAALDPVNGMPLQWNPGRTRGVGAFELVATTDSLIVGSDTDFLGGEWHQKLGAFPLAGGTTPPEVIPPTLPSALVRAETDGSLTSRDYDGTTFGTPAVLENDGWDDVQSAFVAGGKLYYAGSDANLYTRTFDGATLGSATDTNSWVDWNNIGAMAWDNGRLYFTVEGDARLFYRYLSPESDYVGAELFEAPTGGVSFADARAMTIVDGALYVADGAGNLTRHDFDAGVIAGTATVVSGPGVGDGLDWNVPALAAHPDGAPAVTVPDAPINVTAVAGDGEASVTWTPPADNGGSPITGYTVTSDPGGFTTTVDGATLQATVGGLTNATTYTFTVTAENAVGTGPASDPSNPVAPVEPLPGTEVLFVVGDAASPSGGDTAVRDRMATNDFDVTVVDDDDVSAADADDADLVLISSTVSGGLGDTFRDVDEPVAVYKPWIYDDLDITGPTSNIDYGSAGEETTLQIVDDTHLLAAGRSGAVEVVSGPNRFAWGEPGGDGHVIATVDGHPTLFYYDAGETLADGSPAPGCRAGVPAFHETPAEYNSNGWALFDVLVAWATAGCGTGALPTPPGAPTNVAATAGDSQAEVTWDAPADDGGSPITGFNVTVVETGASIPVAADVTTATVTGLTNFDSYTFTVTAENIVGAGPASVPSAPVTPQPPPVPPSAPLNVVAAPGDAQADVTWDLPADDGRSPITGFTVTADPGGATTSVGGGTTSATVTGLTNGDTYTFTVTAENAVGVGPASDASNPVTPFEEPEGTGVLFVVGDAGALRGGETAIRDRLQARGFDVTVQDDNTASPAAADEHAFVLIAASVSSGAIGSTFNGVDEPVAVYKPWLYDDVGITGPAGGTDYGSTVAANVDIDAPAHPAAGGLAGNVQIMSSADRIPWGVAGADADVIASTPAGAALFAYDAGDGLPDGSTAAGCRLGVPAFHDTPTVFNAAGWTLFDAWTTWAASDCGVTPPDAEAPAAPTNVTATAGDGDATVSWTAPDDGGSLITGYTVTSTPGGFQVSVGGASTDATVPGLVNGTSYTFTVTAENAIGVGPESAPSNAVTPEAAPPPPPATGVLFVVRDPGALTVGDAAVNDRLVANGYDVTVTDDGVATAADADGKALVIVSSTASSGQVSDTFKSVDEPVAVYKPWLYDDMALAGPAGGTDYGVVSDTAISITDDAHPLAAGFSGSVQIVNGAAEQLPWAAPGADAAVVAEAAGLATLFAYESGDQLADGTFAAGCRLGVPAYHDTPADFTADGWAIFDGWVDWAATSC